MSEANKKRTNQIESITKLEKLIVAATARAVKMASPSETTLSKIVAEYAETKDADKTVIEQVAKIRDGNATPSDIVKIIESWSLKVAALDEAVKKELADETARAGYSKQLHAFRNVKGNKMLFLTMEQMDIICRRTTMAQYIDEHGIEKTIGTLPFLTAEKEMKALQYLFYGSHPSIMTRMHAFSIIMEAPMENSELMGAIAKAQEKYHPLATISGLELNHRRDIKVYTNEELNIKHDGVLAFLESAKMLAPTVIGSAAYLNSAHIGAVNDYDINIAVVSSTSKVDCENLLMDKHEMKPKFPGSNLYVKTMADGLQLEVSLTTPAEKTNAVVNTLALRQAMLAPMVSELVVRVRDKLRRAGLVTRPLGGISSYALAIMTLHSGLRTGLLRREKDEVTEKYWVSCIRKKALTTKDIVCTVASLVEEANKHAPTYYIQKDKPATTEWSARARASAIYVFDIADPDIKNVTIIDRKQFFKLRTIMEHAIPCTGLVECGANEYLDRLLDRVEKKDLPGIQHANVRKYVTGYSMEDGARAENWHVAVVKSTEIEGNYTVRLAKRKNLVYQMIALDLAAGISKEYKPVVLSSGMKAECGMVRPFTALVKSNKRRVVLETADCIRIHSCMGDSMVSEAEYKTLRSVTMHDLEAAALSEYLLMDISYDDPMWIPDANKIKTRHAATAAYSSAIDPESEDEKVVNTPPIQPDITDLATLPPIALSNWDAELDEIDRTIWMAERVKIAEDRLKEGLQSVLDHDDWGPPLYNLKDL